MFFRFYLMLMVLLLAACQSTPQVNFDYDASRDFSRYRHYVWSEPKLRYQPEDVRLTSDLTEERVIQAIQDNLSLKQISLADAKHPADFIVKPYLIMEPKQETFDVDYGFWGGYWGSNWGGGPIFRQSQTVNYTNVIVQIDFIDARDEKLVWRGQAKLALTRLSGTPEEQTALINKLVDRALSAYPPQKQPSRQTNKPPVAV